MHQVSHGLITSNLDVNRHSPGSKLTNTKNMNDKVKAVELYNKANTLPNSKNDFNFNSLGQKLKNAGAI